MRLEIGNKVAVLDDVLKGSVVKIEGENITVKTDDGMILTFLKSEAIRLCNLPQSHLHCKNLRFLPEFSVLVNSEITIKL